MIELAKPSLGLTPSYLDFIEEMRSAGEKIWEEITLKPSETTKEFVERILSAEKKPHSGLVPETHYWAIKDKIVVGRIALRHALNDNLKEFGGHIGYEVRPSCRCLGIAKEMLRVLLQTSKSKEIGKLLLTCSPDNIASNKTIIANGGVLEKTAYVEKWKRNTNYYWITTISS